MSNFPFNSDEYAPSERYNGCPLTYKQAKELAHDVMHWHMEHSTSDFSQSNDGFEQNVSELALGLMELLADPNAVKRLQTTGKQVKDTVNMLMTSDEKYLSKRTKTELMPILKKLFGFKEKP